MGTLIPGQPLIYERAEGVTYARYRDPPYNSIPRWEIGRDDKRVFGYSDFNRMQSLAEHHEGFRENWEQLITMYFLLKDTLDHPQ